jgi:Spy/CpxP family protein refolding chaperone
VHFAELATGENMIKKLTLAALLLSLVCMLPTLVSAQAAPASTATPPARPFHDGPVWTITFVHTKPGLGLKYMEYLAMEWKKQEDALKKAGYILDYKVIGTESHSPEDWDLMLMTEFKDLATLEANEDKMEAVAMQSMDMNDQRMMQGYQERSSWREIIGDRLAREIILEPKAK